MTSVQAHLTTRAMAKKIAQHTYSITKDLGVLAIEGAAIIGHVTTGVMDATTEERRDGRSKAEIGGETKDHIDESRARVRETAGRLRKKLGLRLKADASLPQMVDSVVQKAEELNIPIDRPTTLDDLNGLVGRMPQVERTKDR